MKTAQNRLKKGIDVIKKYGFALDAKIGKYYFANIKTNKEKYILFLILVFKEDNERILVNKYAYFNADINNVITKYFKL